MIHRKLALASVAATAVALPMFASADSELSMGLAGTNSASADLDFRVVIPSFVYFQVGDPVAGNVDLVDFDLVTAGEEPGTDTDVVGTGGSGDVSVVLRTNAPGITITNATPGGAGVLNDGGANDIPFTEVLVAATGTGDIPVPAWDASTISFAPNGVNSSDTWTFIYDNTAVYPAGTYTATVTYTATDL